MSSCVFFFTNGGCFAAIIVERRRRSDKMVAPVGAIEKAAQILSSFDTKKIEQNLSASLRKNVISFFPSYIVYYTLYGLSIIFFLYYRSN